jgi:ABC-type spermidine/putrescine transport system permease subunit II
MKTSYKISLLNMGFAFLLASLLAYAFDGHGLKDYVSFLGLASTLVAIIVIPVGLLLLLFKRKIWGKGFLLSAGILLLIGFALCSTVL